MRTTLASVPTAFRSALLLLSLVPVVAAQTPVLNPANGHYYAKISAPWLTWTQARAAAEAMTFQGMAGHLATIADASEQSFTHSGLPASAGMWLGGYQDHSSPSYSETSGGWTWVTGEPWSYTAWMASQPDDAYGEDYLEWSPLGIAPINWNDLSLGGYTAGFIVEYEPGMSTYCTAGTTSHGCLPSISSTGTPSASANSGFTIAVGNVEGQQQGLLFYGIDNAGFTPLPWGPSSSFMCVKPPLNRMPVQNGGGTYGACNGLLSIDWNAYRATNPMALGQPLSVGQHVYAQAWFRDPPSPKTTNLSDALAFVVCP